MLWKTMKHKEEIQEQSVTGIARGWVSGAPVPSPPAREEEEEEGEGGDAKVGQECNWTLRTPAPPRTQCRQLPPSGRSCQPWKASLLLLWFPCTIGEPLPTGTFRAGSVCGGCKCVMAVTRPLKSLAGLQASAPMPPLLMTQQTPEALARPRGLVSCFLAAVSTRDRFQVSRTVTELAEQLPSSQHSRPFSASTMNLPLFYHTV
ncbi:hypothetical protein CB1_000526037 [Camelus ferus]|nr:hypothetical protein CB1_000526037 [Camelus ferus]